MNTYWIVWEMTGSFLKILHAFCVSWPRASLDMIWSGTLRLLRRLGWNMLQEAFIHTRFTKTIHRGRDSSDSSKINQCTVSSCNSVLSSTFSTNHYFFISLLARIQAEHIQKNNGLHTRLIIIWPFIHKQSYNGFFQRAKLGPLSSWFSV